MHDSEGKDHLMQSLLALAFCPLQTEMKERPKAFMALFHCMVRHGTVRYGSLLGVFPLGTVPGT